MGRREIVVLARRMCIALALAMSCVVSSAQAQSPTGEATSSADAIDSYRTAVKLQNTGVYELAIDEWNAFLQKHASDPLAVAARHNRGISYFQLGKYVEATKDFAAVIKQPGKFKDLESTYVNLGLAIFNLAQVGDNAESLYGQAVSTFTSQLKMFPSGKHAPLGRFYLAESQYSLGDVKGAVATYGDFLKQHAKHDLAPRAWYGRGVAQAELGQHDEAAASYRTLLNDFPTHAFATEVTMRLGDALFSQGQYEQAVPYFATAAAKEGFVHADYAMLQQGAAQFELGNYTTAAEVYADLSQRFPQSVHLDTARLNAGKAWLHAAQPTKATPWFEQIKAKLPEARHWLARALLQSGDAAAALKEANAALNERVPAEWRVELMLDKADALYELPDQREQSIAVYAQLAERFPQHPRAGWAQFSAAEIALASNDRVAARKYAQAYLAKQTNLVYRPAAMYVLAEADRLDRQYDKAAVAFRQLTQSYPDHKDGTLWLNRLGISLLALQRPQEVVQLLAANTDINKDDVLRAEANYLVGTAHLILEQYDDAVRLLTRAAQLNDHVPFLAQAKLNLARAQHLSGANAAAIQTLEGLIAQHGKSDLLPEAVYRLGVYHAAEGNHQRAAQSLSRLLSDWPQNAFAPHGLYAQAVSYRALGQLDQAKGALDHLLESFSTHEAAVPGRLLRASVLRSLGHFTAAVADVNALLEESDNDKQRGDALYVKGMSEAALKQFDAAAESFRSLLTQYPDYADADRVRYELAWALADGGKAAQAQAAFVSLAQKHPQSELAAEAHFRIGESQYEATQYADAVKSYAAAIKAGATGEIREKALYKQGWSHFLQNRFAEAHRSFTQQVASLGNGELAADARIMAAESLFQNDDYAAAMTEFEAALSHDGASKNLQNAAMLHAAQAGGKLKRWERALALLNQCAKQFPQGEYADEVQYELGWTKYNLQRLDDAKPHFEKVVESSNGVLGARARFMLGELQMQEKKYDEAVRTFYKVAYGYGYPKSPESYHAWQAHAMFEAARCLEQLNKIAAAVKLYTELIENFPKQPQATHARNRLEELANK